VEWTPEGVYSEGLAAQTCEAGLFFYNKLLAETALPAGIKNTVQGFLLAYGVQNTDVGATGLSVGVLYSTVQAGLGYTGDAKYFFIQGALVYKDGGNPDTDLTGRKILVASNSTQYAIIRKQAGGFDAAVWNSSETRFESVGARSSSSSPSVVGMDSEGLGSFYYHQNFRAPRVGFLGGDTFTIPATDADVTDRISMLLAFMSSTAFYTKGVPGAGIDNTTIGDESVRVIQEELPQSDVSAPPTPSVLALTDDSGAYISNDGGDNWVRVIVSQRYRDLAYISSEFLVRPFDKTEPVR
jgi:hypothetical protein